MSSQTASPNGRHRGDQPVGPAAWIGPTALAGKILAAVLSAVLLLAVGYDWYNVTSLERNIPRLHLDSLGQKAVNAPVAAPTSGGAATTAARPKVNGEDENILMVGLDTREGLTPAEEKLLKVGDDASMSTDTMMIVHVPADGSKATLISLPRDSYVDIPGYKKNKLNAAYVDGYTYTTGTAKQKQAAGADELVKTIKGLTGLSIDHYVQVSFEGFYTITKAIGTIPVNLCQAADDTVAHNATLGVRGGSGFVMSAGEHDLTPVQALEFVRQRHGLSIGDATGDLARVERQQYFLTQAFSKIESAGTLLNPSKLNNLIKAIAGSFYIDDGLDITDLAEQMINLSANHITGTTIPTDGTANEGGNVGDVVLVDPAKVAAWAQKIIAGSPTPDASSPTASSTNISSTGATATAPKSGGDLPTHPATAHCIN